MWTAGLKDTCRGLIFREQCENIGARSPEFDGKKVRRLKAQAQAGFGPTLLGRILVSARIIKSTWCLGSNDIYRLDY
jgi:hypothetical protein